MSTKMIYVALAAGFLNAIVLDADPAHPGGVAHIVRDSKSDEPPVYEVAETPFIVGKMREGILREVRDFDPGTDYAWNDPDHPRHDDPLPDLPTLGSMASSIASAPVGLTDAQRQEVEAAVVAKLGDLLAQVQVAPKEPAQAEATAPEGDATTVKPGKAAAPPVETPPAS